MHYIEWSEPNEERRIRGWLRGHPDTTLFIIQLTEGRDDRGTMWGAFVPDRDDGADHLKNALLSFLKISAGIYMREFYDSIKQVLDGREHDDHLTS